MFDLKVINAVLGELEEERGIPREKVLEAIEASLATAYKKEYGKRGQIIKAKFNLSNGAVEMLQVKIVVDEINVFLNRESYEAALEKAEETNDERELFNPEKHILVEDARKIKKVKKTFLRDSERSEWRRGGAFKIRSPDFAQRKFGFRPTNTTKKITTSVVIFLVGVAGLEPATFAM